MSFLEQKEVSQGILRYLLRHPDAQDTLEGISEWWLFEERIIQKIAEVQNALEKLVTQGFILEKQTSDASVLYRLNKRKKNLIKKIVDDEVNVERTGDINQ